MDPEEYTRMYELEETYWWFAGKRRIAATLLSPHTDRNQSLRILDVGCGTGGMLRHLLGSYGHALGVDLSPDALRYCRMRGLNGLSQASAGALPFSAATFDLVTAFDVLYHQWVEDDLLALRESARVLRPGGLLLVTDSAFQFLYSEHDVRCRGRHRYTAGELRQRVEQVGLQVLKLSYANTVLFPVVAALRLFSGKTGSGGPGAADLQPLPGWLNSVLGAVYKLEAAGLRWVSYPFGVSVVCLARKF